MRLIRLFTLVLIVSFVVLIMTVDLTKSYSAVAKTITGTVKTHVPAAMLKVK